MTRPSPSESATAFPVGTEKVGGDGRVWVVTQAANGVRRWAPRKSDGGNQGEGGSQGEGGNQGDREACVRAFVRYERKRGNVTNVIQGAGFEKDGKKYVRDEDGIVYDVEPGFRRVKVSEFLLAHFCKAPLDLVRLKAAGAISIEDWYAASRPKWWSIGDVLAMKAGDRVKLLAMDRNLRDTSDDVNVEGKAFAPARFFRKNWAEFTKTDELRGFMRWPWQEKGDAPLPFEFDVEYKRGSWYPFKGGFLPSSDPQSLFVLFGKKKHWTAFPKNTHVGWRGPMVAWSHLATMPKVYHA